MQEIEDILYELRVAAVPPAVSDLDGVVLACTAQMRSVETRRTGAVAATVALCLGFAGSSLSATQAPPEQSAPLGALSPLAPSTLLAG